MDNINNIINKIYKKDVKLPTFMGKYGIDLFISIIIVLVFFIAISYYYVINHLPNIKANWDKNKCNPVYMPFAGIISNTDKSNLEVVGENFETCTQNILISIASEAFKPIYYAMNTLTSGLTEMTQATTAIRAFFNKIRVDVANTSESISGRTLNVTIPFVKQIIYFKNMIAQFNGLLTASLYTFFGSYLTGWSLLGAIIELVKIILIAVAAAIAAALGIPFVGWAIAAPIIAFQIAILVFFIPVSGSFNSISWNSMPMSACFDKYTQIPMSHPIGTNKNICDINIGDKLSDGSRVTGIMKMSSYGETVYNLNGVLVTGLHRVYHETSGWIKVADHPDSIRIQDYRESIVYCLNTDTKVIKIGEQTFSDWDDLDDKDLAQINKFNIIDKDINNSDIHPYLDNGFGEDTPIEIQDGNIIKIKDIEVNDVLRFGERVLGIIKIDANNINSIKEYLINGIPIISTTNIQMFNEYLGSFNIDSLEGTPKIVDGYLYQLITDKGSFHINGTKVSDYNFGIEKYLDNIYYYPQNLYH